jgi:hypothetical protein
MLLVRSAHSVPEAVSCTLHDAEMEFVKIRQCNACWCCYSVGSPYYMVFHHEKKSNYDMCGVSWHPSMGGGSSLQQEKERFKIVKYFGLGGPCVPAPRLWRHLSLDKQLRNPARRLLRQYKHRGAPVILRTALWTPKQCAMCRRLYQPWPTQFRL